MQSLKIPERKPNIQNIELNLTSYTCIPSSLFFSQFLAVAFPGEIRVYNQGIWDEAFSLSEKSIEKVYMYMKSNLVQCFVCSAFFQEFSVIAFSPGKATAKN
jgi:hypothetical protein